MAAANPYEKLIARILAEIDAGEVPWRKPWTSLAPRSLSTGKEYRGTNRVLLSYQGYTCPYWATFGLIKNLGGRLRKGEKGTPILGFTMVERKDTDDPSDPAAAERRRRREEERKRDEEMAAQGWQRLGSKDDDKIPVARAWFVYNLEQCEDINAIKGVPAWGAPGNHHQPIEAAEAIVMGMSDRPPIHQGGGRAFYVPSEDRITVPPLASFEAPEYFYATVFHELGHSTGHPRRLNRKGVANFDHFGSDRYSREELVAELTAAMLCSEAGITPNSVIENSAAYLREWGSKLRQNPRLFADAASQAQKAADYVLGRQAEDGGATAESEGANERASVAAKGTSERRVA